MKNNSVQFDIGSYKQTVDKFYDREQYKNNSSSPHIKEYLTHWIIVRSSEENAVQYFSNKLKDRTLLEKSDPNDDRKPLTLALAILFKKEKVKQYLLQNVFNSIYFLPKKFSEYHEAEQYLLRGIFQHSLKNAWYYDGDKEISFSKMSIQQIHEKFQVDSYQDFVYSRIRTTFLKARE